MTGRAATIAWALALALALPVGTAGSPAHGLPAAVGVFAGSAAVGNFSAALNRLVELVAAAGGALLALVWVRVALSWFSHDGAKKVLAKERARDAAIGTLLFTAAVSGLIWGLAHWVLTGA